MNIDKYMKAILKLGYACNNDCNFCHAKPKRDTMPLDLSQISKKIHMFKDKDVQMILLSGGEPTIRKDLFQIISLIKDEGLKFGLITNGRMMSSQDFFSKMKSEGPDYIYMSLYGSTPEINNLISRDDSFLQSINAIKNIVSSEMNIIINVVVVNENINDLNNIVELCFELGVKNLKFSAVEPVNNKEIIPKISDSARSVLGAIELGIKKGMNMLHDGFPKCLIDEPMSQEDNLITNNILFMTEAFEEGIYPCDYGDRIKTSKCQTCTLNEGCKGVYRSYIAFFGDSELSPQ